MQYQIVSMESDVQRSLSEVHEIMNLEGRTILSVVDVTICFHPVVW